MAQLLHAQGLVDDIGALRPTIFIGVPRVFDRIYSGVLSKIQVHVGREACVRIDPVPREELLPGLSHACACQAAVAPSRKLENTMMQEAGGLKAFLFNWGFKRKLHFIEQGYPQHSVSTCAGCCQHHAGIPSAHAMLFCSWAEDTCQDKYILHTPVLTPQPRQAGVAPAL